MRTFLTLILLTTACQTPAEPIAEADAAKADTTEKADATEKAEADDAKAEMAKAPEVAKVGQPAPAFSLTDLDGKSHSLADYTGKTVVLEWFNPGCPYVVAAHEEGGPLTGMPGTFMEKDVVWLAVNSGAPGKEGHGLETNKKAAEAWGIDYPILLDEEGTVGRAYGAKTTPHMYVIDGEGTLVYAGALDNAPRNEVPDVGRKGFTEEALTATLAGEAVKTDQTQPWGCSVKYGS